MAIANSVLFYTIVQQQIITNYTVYALAFINNLFCITVLSNTCSELSILDQLFTETQKAFDPLFITNTKFFYTIKLIDSLKYNQFFDSINKQEEDRCSANFANALFTNLMSSFNEMCIYLKKAKQQHRCVSCYHFFSLCCPPSFH